MTAQQVVRTDDGGEVSSTPEMYRNVTSGFHVCLFGIGRVTCRFTGRQSVKTPLLLQSHRRRLVRVEVQKRGPQH